MEKCPDLLDLNIMVLLNMQSFHNFHLWTIISYKKSKFFFQIVIYLSKFQGKDSTILLKLQNRMWVHIITFQPNIFFFILLFYKTCLFIFPADFI